MYRHINKCIDVTDFLMSFQNQFYNLMYICFFNPMLKRCKIFYLPEFFAKSEIEMSDWMGWITTITAHDKL